MNIKSRYTIQLHGLRCGMSSRVMFPSFPHLSLVVHVSKSGPGVECVPEKTLRRLTNRDDDASSTI